MAGFIRTLIFLIGSYYLIRFVMRLFAPDKKMPKQEAPPRSTTVDYTQKKSNRSNSDDRGEYIEYEEVK